MLSPDILRKAILDLKEPVVFKGFKENVTGEKNPEFLRWKLDMFVDIFGDTPLPFRTGNNERTLKPQWDVECAIEHMTLSEFIKRMDESEFTDEGELKLKCMPPKWYYFDYKYIHDWFKDRPDVVESIDWNRFGFDKNGNDSTLWIGSPGAHTNCHQDSYGCNLVAQIKGSKRWLLYPPDTGDALRPTRVPYEESTVYSKFNFFCPTKEDEEGIMGIEKHPRLVILSPGDVLLVPHGWWHYVESENFSISINVWLPVEDDYKARLKEALVKLLASNIGVEIPSAPQDGVPNSRRECIDLIETCIEECKKHTNSSSNLPSYKKVKTSLWTAQDLAKEYPNSVKLVPEISHENQRRFLLSNRQRFSHDGPISFHSSHEKLEDSTFQRSLEDIMNALCNFEVINKVSDLLLDYKCK